jgi:hypothetical protein
MTEPDAEQILEHLERCRRLNCSHPVYGWIDDERRLMFCSRCLRDKAKQ